MLDEVVAAWYALDNGVPRRNLGGEAFPSPSPGLLLLLGSTRSQDQSLQRSGPVSRGRGEVSVCRAVPIAEFGSFGPWTLLEVERTHFVANNRGQAPNNV